MSASLASIFNPGGLLSGALPSYESRPQQLEMAQAVADCIRTSSHLLVEAGTGTGKSLAYLVPFILWAVENEKKVLVATYTKTLQQQLVEKDIPLLRRALAVDFRHALCLGTQNYLCPRRLRQTKEVGLFTTRKEVEQFQALGKWAKETHAGLVRELDFEPSPGLWGQVSRETDLCLAKECQLYDESFYWKARRQQQKAHILVANHHLFFANLTAAGNVLPRYDAVVFDEAHNLEAVASAYLGLEVSNHSVHYLLDRIWGRRSGGLLKSLGGIPVEVKAEVESLVSECRDAVEDLFENAWQRVGNRFSATRVRERGFVANVMEQPLRRLVQELRRSVKWVAGPAEGNERLEPTTSPSLEDSGEFQVEERKAELEAFVGRIEQLQSNLTSFLSQEVERSVYWVEASAGARQTRITFRSAPFDLSELLQANLFDVMAPIVLTSATLTHGNSFGFMQQRLGLEKATTVSVGSPFNFQEQVLLYVANDLPEPGPGRSDAEQAAIQRAADLVRASGGRAFVLCTSHRMVQQCADQFEEQLPQYRLLRQGDMPRDRLLELFHEDVGSVLVGTSTFWQGVDVPGEALECVVIVKLPFAVPDDPLVQARMEFLQSQGLDPFSDYQVPQAVLQLRQGFGRLIRHRSDFGMVALLDPRVVTKRYGRAFLNSLPACQSTNSLEEVTTFFARHRAERGNGNAPGE
ncbi:MAG: ATP-dependent DNA helicase [Armatimonadetes bacterium]|nr:ATP-dependent DNA helicase [Armatimonadota bacterium]